MRIALVNNGIVENIAMAVDVIEAELIFPGLEAYIELADDTMCNPGWTWNGGTDFSADGADTPIPLVQIDDPPVNGLVLRRSYWQTYDEAQPYVPGINPSGLARTEDWTWEGDRVISKLISTYDGKGNVIEQRIESYSTTETGATVVRGE